MPAVAERPQKKLAVLCSFSGDGGVERIVKLLCAELAKSVQVDLLVMRMEGAHAKAFPENVNLVPLKARHSATVVPELARYLKEAKPEVLLAAKDRAGRAALRAQRRAGSTVPVWLQIHTNLSAALEGKTALRRWLRSLPMRRAYPAAAGVICVSEGVRQDVIKLSGLPASRVHAIYNPVISPEIERLAAEPIPHEWLRERSVPVVIGIGRLTRQKDFATLIQAFALMQTQRACRLILLGEGAEREALQQCVDQLGLNDRVLFAGFQSNPYAWLARADVFALSSAWEGSPTVLAEALALGVPSVSTRCPSGPSEMLAEGRYGPLVAVGDHAALAQAMIDTLAAPLPPETLREAVAEYRVEISARRYLQQLGLI